MVFKMSWSTIIQKAIEQKKGIKEANEWWISTKDKK